MEMGLASMKAAKAGRLSRSTGCQCSAACCGTPVLKAWPSAREEVMMSRLDMEWAGCSTAAVAARARASETFGPVSHDSRAGSFPTGIVHAAQQATRAACTERRAGAAAELPPLPSRNDEMLTSAWTQPPPCQRRWSALRTSPPSPLTCERRPIMSPPASPLPRRAPTQLRLHRSREEGGQLAAGGASTSRSTA